VQLTSFGQPGTQREESIHTLHFSAQNKICPERQHTTNKKIAPCLFKEKTTKRKNLRFWCFEGKGNAPVPTPLAVAQRKQVGFLHHFRHVDLLSIVGLCNSN
jgi:hypothetical protein